MRGYRSVLAWSLGGIAVVLTLITAQLIVLNHLKHPGDAVYPLGFVGLALVGAFVAAYRPDNAIGWLFCLAGFTNIVDNAAQQYAVYALRTHPGAPGGMFMFWLGAGWLASVGWGTMGFFIPLLFPTGRLLSPRWRVAAVLGVAALGAQVLAQAFTQGSDVISYLPSVRNPYIIPAFQAVSPVLAPVVQFSDVPIMLACITSLVLRYRHAGHVERLQIKWFAYAAGILVTMIVVSILNSATVNNAVLNQLGDPLFFMAITLLPLAAAIAMMKYRLYDIDVFINRTLVYGSLTISLAAVYILAVIGLEALFRAVTGQSSDLAIAIATLAIAALFSPWRRRLQIFIDRRFYRRRYDVSQTLSAFTAQLRDEVDLDRLSGDLAMVVRETMEPTTVMLWLREVPLRRSVAE
jgi:hypothetical protein